MNDDEIKAIDNFKRLDFFEYDWQIGEDEDFATRDDMLEYAEKMQKIILNLIENQQKEIEKLNFENHMVKKWNEQLDKNCISKDEIREKIKEYQEKAEDVKQKYKGVYAYKDDYLEALAKIEGYQKLLEEN